MNKPLVYASMLLLAAGAAGADTYECGWEEDVTVLATYPEDGDMIYSRVMDPVHGGTYSLELVDNLESGTPQVYVALIYGLQAGDVVTSGFWRYDDTPGASPSCRIWAHWNNNLPDDIMGYDGSASGNEDYGPGTGWDYTEWDWTVPAGTSGLVIEARTYSEAGHTAWIDDLFVDAPAHATVVTPCVGVSVQDVSWSALKAGLAR